MSKKPILIKNEAQNDMLFWRSPVQTVHKKSQLLVRPTDVAFFEKNGVLLNMLESGQHTIHEKEPLFKSLFSKKTMSDISILYMNKTVKNQLLWGTPDHFMLIDSEYKVPVYLGASGSIDVRIDNPRKFYHEIIGRNKNYTLKDLKDRIKSKLISHVEAAVTEITRTHQKSLLHVSEMKQEIESSVSKELDTTFKENYGLDVSSFELRTLFLTASSIESLLTAKQNHETAKTMPKKENQKQQTITETTPQEVHSTKKEKAPQKKEGSKNLNINTES